MNSRLFVAVIVSTVTLTFNALRMNQVQWALHQFLQSLGSKPSVNPVFPDWDFVRTFARYLILSRMTYMTIEQFRQIHEDWKQSGLSVQQYCENTGLTESRFYYWKSKLKAESLPSACGSFIPVKMSGKSTVYSARNTSGKALCEIEYPNGVVVHVTSDMTLDQLRQMVTLLR